MKTLKRLAAVLAVICLVCAAFPCALGANENTAEPSVASIVLNGRQVRLQAYEINGNNYFKLRDLALLMNGTRAQFSVDWDEETDSVTLTAGERYSEVGGEGELLQQGSAVLTAPASSAIMLNGQKLKLTVYMINNNNYFMLRDIMSVLDVGVDWDESLQTIIVDTEKSYSIPWQISPSSTLLTSEQIASMAESVVMLRMYDKEGEETSLATGFFITADGWLATCYHAIENSYKAEALCDDGKVYPISAVLAYNSDYDTAIVQVDVDKAVKPLGFAYSRSLARGQRVMAIGSPQGEQNTISDGLVSTVSRDAKGLRCRDALDIQVSVPISKGSSGGPLLDMYGNVVGIIYAMHNYGQNMNYAIQTEEFMTLFDHINRISFAEFYKLTYVDDALSLGSAETSFIY